MIDLSPETQQRVKERAAREGVTVDALLNRWLEQTEEEAFAAQNRIILSERDFAAFMDAINNPPAPPTPGLLAAIADYDKRHNTANTGPTP